MVADGKDARATPTAFAQCVHLVAPRAQASARACARTRPRVTMRAPPSRRPSRAGGVDAPSDGPTASFPSAPPAVWAGVRRAVRLSAVSLSVLLCSLGGAPPARASSPPAGGSVRVQRESASDVEAAAVTLGAVTVGGLVMRAVLASRHDEEKERAQLAEECARLEREEMLHARRLQRKAMERVEGGEELPGDDTLQSSLMKRVQDLGEEDEGEEAEEKFMRQTPVPDRGTGSMLLERPEEGEEGARGEAEEEDVSPERLEMLNRMWNLSSPDDDERKKS